MVKKSKKRAFSLVDAIIILTVVAVAVVASTPILSRKVVNNSDAGSTLTGGTHGRYELFYKEVVQFNGGDWYEKAIPENTASSGITVYIRKTDAEYRQLLGSEPTMDKEEKVKPVLYEQVNGAVAERSSTNEIVAVKFGGKSYPVGGRYIVENSALTYYKFDKANNKRIKDSNGNYIALPSNKRVIEGNLTDLQAKKAGSNNLWLAQVGINLGDTPTSVVDKILWQRVYSGNSLIEDSDKAVDPKKGPEVPSIKGAKNVVIHAVGGGGAGGGISGDDGGTTFNRTIMPNSGTSSGDDVKILQNELARRFMVAYNKKIESLSSASDKEYIKKIVCTPLYEEFLHNLDDKKVSGSVFRLKDNEPSALSDSACFAPNRIVGVINSNSSANVLPYTNTAAALNNHWIVINKADGTISARFDVRAGLLLPEDLYEYTYILGSQTQKSVSYKMPQWYDWDVLNPHYCVGGNVIGTGGQTAPNFVYKTSADVGKNPLKDDGTVDEYYEPLTACYANSRKYLTETCTQIPDDFTPVDQTCTNYSPSNGTCYVESCNSGYIPNATHTACIEEPRFTPLEPEPITADPEPTEPDPGSDSDSDSDVDTGSDSNTGSGSGAGSGSGGGGSATPRPDIGRPGSRFEAVQWAAKIKYNNAPQQNYTDIIKDFVDAKNGVPVGFAASTQVAHPDPRTAANLNLDISQCPIKPSENTYCFIANGKGKHEVSYTCDSCVAGGKKNCIKTKCELYQCKDLHNVYTCTHNPDLSLDLYGEFSCDSEDVTCDCGLMKAERHGEATHTYLGGVGGAAPSQVGIRRAMNEFKTNGFAKIEAYYENQCCNKLTDCVVEKEVSKILPWNHNDEGTERKVYKSCGNYGACNGYTSSITIDDYEVQSTGGISGGPFRYNITSLKFDVGGYDPADYAKLKATDAGKSGHVGKWYNYKTDEEGEYVVDESNNKIPEYENLTGYYKDLEEIFGRDAAEWSDSGGYKKATGPNRRKKPEANCPSGTYVIDDDFFRKEGAMCGVTKTRGATGKRGDYLLDNGQAIGNNPLGACANLDYKDNGIADVNRIYNHVHVWSAPFGTNMLMYGEAGAAGEYVTAKIPKVTSDITITLGIGGVAQNIVMKGANGTDTVVKMGLFRELVRAKGGKGGAPSQNTKRYDMCFNKAGTCTAGPNGSTVNCCNNEIGMRSTKDIISTAAKLSGFEAIKSLVGNSSIVGIGAGRGGEGVGSRAGVEIMNGYRDGNNISYANSTHQTLIEGSDSALPKSTYNNTLLMPPALNRKGGDGAVIIVW